MSLNPDQAKWAKEVIFSRKTNKIIHTPFYFKNATVKLTHAEKHLGFRLDTKLSFKEHTNNKTSKATKYIGLLRKFQLIISRRSLFIIYQSFIRPHVDYCYVIDDGPSNTSFPSKIESVQYNAARAIAVAIMGSSLDPFYQELELEYL